MKYVQWALKEREGGGWRDLNFDLCRDLGDCNSNICIYFVLFSVVRAELVGSSVSNTTTTYVTLKLQSVKSTTVPVKGTKPTWNQDFLL